MIAAPGQSRHQIDALDLDDGLGFTRKESWPSGNTEITVSSGGHPGSVEVNSLTVTMVPASRLSSSCTQRLSSVVSARGPAPPHAPMAIPVV